jgi:hypothetical protein
LDDGLQKEVEYFRKLTNEQGTEKN